MYNSIYVPTLTYGLETSILEKKHKSKIQASEMKYLRQTLGKNKRDKVRNTKIRDDTKQQPLNDKIEQRQLAWFGHTLRMNNNRIPKRIVERKPEGKRPKGRLRTTYEDQITKLAVKRGKTMAEIRKLARDRKKYRSWIDEAPTL